MGNLLERLVFDPLNHFLEKVLLFLPNLFAALFILIIGFLVGWVIKALLVRMLRVLKVDDFAERSGLPRMFARAGIRDSFSALISRFVGSLIVLTFCFISLGTLSIPAVESLIERFFVYLPSIFVALVIVLIGYLLGNFLGRAALIASVNAGVTVAGLVGRAVKLTIVFFSLSIALEQLGIGKNTVLIAFAIVFGGVVLAIAIAFGLGGRDAAKAILERKFSEPRGDEEIDHL